jgi:hypothetical protein
MSSHFVTKYASNRLYLGQQHVPDPTIIFCGSWALLLMVTRTKRDLYVCAICNANNNNNLITNIFPFAILHTAQHDGVKKKEEEIKKEYCQKVNINTFRI